MSSQSTVAAPQAATKNVTAYPVLFSISVAHLLNDLLQSTIPSLYPLVKQTYQLSFSQIGWITFAFQLTASILQPFVGNYTDRNPRPYSFVAGMCATLAGVILLSMANGFHSLLVAVSLVGVGSSIFHPEASRVAYFASGGRRGLAQSIFQLGGNTGSAIGPLLVAAIVIPRGQGYVLWFTLAALLGLVVLGRVGSWYKAHLFKRAKQKSRGGDLAPGLTRRRVLFSLFILLLLIFSKYFYLTSITSYFTFFLIQKFGLSVQQSQFHLFLFLVSVAAGTFLGGPLGDRFGRKIIIWISILGIAPFTLLLPHANLFWTSALVIVIGLILASAFSAILVYAQELVPGKVGTISGLFFGFAFGIAGIGSALLGHLADRTSIDFVFRICAWLPLIGVVAGFLPDLRSTKPNTQP